MASRFPENERVMRLSAPPGDQGGTSPHSISLPEDDARRAYGEATALLRGDQVEAGTEAYIRVLNQSPRSVLELIRKDVEGFFGEEHLERAVARRNDDLGWGILDLWMNDDPTPTTVGNEVLAEFYKRLEEVRRRFGMPIGDLGYDDRGRVWLRLGAPDERFEGPGPPDFYPNETWLYRRASGRRLVLNFVDLNNTGFRFASSIGEAIPTWTRRKYLESLGSLSIAPVMRALEEFLIPRTTIDPVYFQILNDVRNPPPSREPVGNTLNNLSRYDGYIGSASMATALSSMQVQQDAAGERVEIAVHPVTFEDGDTYTTWLLIGYPLAELTASIDSSGSYVYTINKAASVFRSDGSVAFTREAQSTAHTPTKVESPDFVTVDGIEFASPPGEYRLGVRVKDVNSNLVGLYRLPLNLAEIEKSALRLSDIVLADRIEPGGDQARFSRNGLQIVPSPTRTFDRARAIWLYFEAYPPNDRLNEPHNYQVEVRVKSSDRRASITQQVFRGLGRLLGREGGNEITVAYEREFGAGTPVYETLSLDASGLAEGIYQLDITVIDLNAGESATKSTEFAVHNRR